MNISPDPKNDIVNRKTRTATPLPSRSSYLPLVLGGSYWRAQDSFKNIIVFGDSYGASYQGGVWVHSLVRRLQMRGHSPNVHNFAVPGDTAEDDLSDRLSLFFQKFPERKSGDATPILDSATTTYFVFLGINDCGSRSSDALESIVEDFFDALHQLYVKTQAKNFVLIDVPPIDRSPQAMELDCMETVGERVNTWNKLLQTQAVEFQSSVTDATVLIFSSHKLFTDILNDPMEYEFTEDDPDIEGGGIWVNDLHPTTERNAAPKQQTFPNRELFLHTAIPYTQTLNFAWIINLRQPDFVDWKTWGFSVTHWSSIPYTEYDPIYHYIYGQRLILPIPLNEAIHAGEGTRVTIVKHFNKNHARHAQTEKKDEDFKHKMLKRKGIRNNLPFYENYLVSQHKCSDYSITDNLIIGYNKSRKLADNSESTKPSLEIMFLGR